MRIYGEPVNKKVSSTCTKCGKDKRRDGGKRNAKVSGWKCDHCRYLKKVYNITIDIVRALYDKQNGKCSICNQTLARYHIDHNHTTGKVRGLLCFHCNTGIGHLRENVDTLNSAIAYLKEHATINTL